MSLSKTQDYVYFQNKASHYHNIIQAKTRLDTKIQQNLIHTIDYHDIRNAKRHIPHMTQFQIKSTNQNMLRRILSKDKSPLNKHDTYSRYNTFERSFRHRNPQKNKQQRLIQIQNNKLRKSISKARAQVGSIDKWRKTYDENVKHSRLVSKFVVGNNKLKDQLEIQTEKFLPEKYLKYLEQAQAQVENQEELGENSRLDDRQSSRNKIKGRINVQKLFTLPRILSPNAQRSISSSRAKVEKIEKIEKN